MSLENSSDTRMKLARSVRLILLAAAGAAAPHTVFAQDPVAESAIKLDEIIVTGSRIRGSEVVGSPVTEVSREDIELEFS